LFALAGVLIAGALVWLFNPFAAAEPSEPARPTIEPVRLAYSTSPTKFARLVPSPTSTATSTETATPTDTPTRTRVPTKRPTNTPTTTATPTHAPTPTNTLAPTVEPPPYSAPTGTGFGTLSIQSPPTDRPAAQNADLNLSLRGYTRINADLTLVNYDGEADPGAPQFAGLFGDNRTPKFTRVFQIYHWNWGCNCRASPIDDPEVTLLGMGVSAGEAIYVPEADLDIGDGFVALVLYADADRVTLKYTREDNVQYGYTLHVEGIAVDSNLLGAYQQLNAAGRHELPALRARKFLGRASGTEIRVAIRDAGTFLDPRSRKDWWRGR
jgi:hypothetical protein